MADLAGIAQRLNDVEINANQPVTQSVFQRIGSSVNYLLDILGVANGETSSGPVAGIEDLFNAIALIRNHTLEFQASVNTIGGPPTVIGTYPVIPFVNHVLYLRCTGPGFVLEDNLGASNTTAIFKKEDGEPNFVTLTAAHNTPNNGINAFSVFTGQEATGGTQTNKGNVTKNPTSPYEKYRDTAYGDIGFEPQMRDNEWIRGGVLDWRSYTNNVEILIQTQTSTLDVYLAYELNVTSAPLYF